LPWKNFKSVSQIGEKMGGEGEHTAPPRDRESCKWGRFAQPSFCKFSKCEIGVPRAAANRPDYDNKTSGTTGSGLCGTPPTRSGFSQRSPLGHFNVGNLAKTPPSESRMPHAGERKAGQQQSKEHTAGGPRDRPPGPMQGSGIGPVRTNRAGGGGNHTVKKTTFGFRSGLRKRKGNNPAGRPAFRRL